MYDDGLRLPIGDECIDKKLEGGLLSGTITEIFGESGSTKTQLCYHFMKSFLQIIQDEKILYLSVGQQPSSKRMMSIICNSNLPNTSFNRIIIESCAKNIDDLFIVLSESVLENLGIVRLIVVDPITMFVSCENNYSESLKKLGHIFGKLNAYCKAKNAWIIVVNDGIRYNSSYLSRQTNDIGKWRINPIHPSVFKIKTKPALGISWSSMIDTRICMERLEEQHEPHKRVLTLVHSCYLPGFRIQLLITEEGLKFLS